MSPENENRSDPHGDARRLLDYAIETGVELDEEMSAAIRAGDGIRFEQEYAKLARLMKPVSARTLRATAGQRSEARRWCFLLWYITITVLALILLAGMLASFESFQPIDVTPDREVLEQGRAWPLSRALADFALPFLFGLLGACAYLLRTLNKLIYTRSFNPDRKPQYIDRMLLGFISGGAGGVLFARYILGAEGNTAEFSASAIGFLCGYNTDFLFVAIERLAAALLPKVPPSDPPAGEPAEPPINRARRTPGKP